MGDKITQLILEKIKNPTVQKVRVLSAPLRGKEDFGITGLQSIDQPTNDQEKEQKVSNLIPNRTTKEDDVAIEETDAKCPNFVPRLGIT